MQLTHLLSALLALSAPMAFAKEHHHSANDRHASDWSKISNMPMYHPEEDNWKLVRAIPSRFIKIPALPSFSATPTIEAEAEVVEGPAVEESAVEEHAVEERADILTVNGKPQIPGDGVIYREEMEQWMKIHGYKRVNKIPKWALRQFMDEQGVSWKECPYGCDLD